MQNPFDQFDAAPVQSPQTPGVIMGRPKAGPSAYQQQQDADSDRRADISTDLSVQSGGRSERGQVQDFRKEFDSSVPVKTYGIAITSLSNAIKRGEDGSGDVALIYDYAKAMDPESVVRESEVGMAQAGQSAIESAAARFRKEFGIEGGGVLDPNTRQFLRREIINAARSRRQAYEQQRERFVGLAERNNFNPIDIVGPDLGEPYRDELSHFGVSGRRFTDDEMAARRGEPVAPGARPNDRAPQGPTGNFANTVNTDALGPGESFVFDETGAPVGIRAADGSISGYSAIVDNASEREARERLEAQGDMGYATGGEAGLNRGIMLGLSDEIAGVAGGLGNMVRGGSFGEGYQQTRDVERAAQDISREQAGILPELAGGLLIPGGALGQARNAGQFVRQGATIGAIGGFGEGEGFPGSATNALVGAGAGAALGGALSQVPRGMNALMQTQAGQRVTGALDNALARGRPPVDADVIAAGQRQSVPIRLADAVESKRPDMAALEKTKTGAPRVAGARAEDITATQGALQRLSPDGATARDEGTLGAALQAAMERTNAKAKDATSALYNRVDRLAPGARSDGAETLAYIDGEIARLAGAGKRGNASSIKALQDMRDDLAETGISVESLQSLRQSIRQRVQDNNLDMRSGDALLSRVDQAATKELEGALSAANPRAVGAFRNANKSHAERLAFRREVARELLGTPNNPLDAEKAATRFMAKISAKGDEKGFNRVWESLDDGERKDIAATLVENMAGGESFSFAKLATALDPDKVNYRTLRTVFGADGAEALKDLRLIASRKNQTQRGLNNSNTGSIVEAKGNSLLDTILTVFGYTQGGIAGAVAGGAARGVGEKVANSWRSRLLLNPDFTKWLRQAPNTNNPAAINRYFDRLNKIASREQAFLMDAKQMQAYLADQFSKGTGRAAAEEQTENNRRE